jgi:DNA repair exonuclease SbcCD nuclease subunit
MSLRLLHTADWQLGRSFAGLPGEAAYPLREARFEAVRSLAALARERRADAVLVAGDVFDDNLVSTATVARALDAMRGFQGPWVLLPGNHDAATAASVWGRLRQQKLPANLVLALEPQPLTLLDGRLVVLPAPLTARRAQDDLSAWMDAAASPAGAFRVGLAHGAVEGRLPAEAEASNPIAADRATRARLDYLALGDWHGTLEVAPRTWYAGTPEPDRFHDNDAGHALLVELATPGAPPAIEVLPTASYRWRAADLDCTGLGEEEVASSLNSLAGTDARHKTLLRLRLHGAVSLATRAALERQIERFAGELCWLDLDEAGLADEPDAADLAALMAEPVTAVTARRLSELATAASTLEERDAARLALRLLFVEARGLRGEA